MNREKIEHMEKKNWTDTYIWKDRKIISTYRYKFEQIVKKKKKKNQ